MALSTFQVYSSKTQHTDFIKSPPKDTISEGSFSSHVLMSALLPFAAEMTITSV